MVTSHFTGSPCLLPPNHFVYMMKNLMTFGNKSWIIWYIFGKRHTCSLRCRSDGRCVTHARKKRKCFPSIRLRCVCVCRFSLAEYEIMCARAWVRAPCTGFYLEKGSIVEHCLLQCDVGWLRWCDARHIRRTKRGTPEQPAIPHHRGLNAQNVIICVTTKQQFN